MISVGIVAYDIGVFATEDRPHAQVAEVGGTDLISEELRLGNFEIIQGTDFLYAELAAPRRIVGSGYSGGLGTARNLLFFDTRSKNAHWLFENNDNDILSWSMVHNKPGRNRIDETETGRFVVGMILQIAVHEDKPNPDRPRDLVFISEDGKDVSPLVSSIDAQLGRHHIDSQTVLIFYLRDGSVNVLDVDTTTGIVRSDSPLSVED